MLLSKQALAQQMDQMADMAELSAAQIQANNSMNRMTHMMGQSSRTMSLAQKTMNPEKVQRHSYIISRPVVRANLHPTYVDSRHTRAVQAAERRVCRVQRDLPGRHLSIDKRSSF